MESIPSFPDVSGPDRGPEALRLYDPARRPPNWTDIVRAGQFVAFSKLIESGASCDAGGQPFASVDQATCLVFDSLDAARAWCVERAGQVPAVRFEIFDSAGRSNPPLLVVVDPSREQTLETDPRAMRRRKWTAIGLTLAAFPLIVFDYWTSAGTLVLPTFLGITMIVTALRLLFLNMVTQEAERTRLERLARHQ